MDNKENRTFICVVIKINNINYYASLTSPKPKHLKMKNQMDFLKIDNGKLGAINFNNMIPVNDTNLSKIEISSIEDIQYKKLLENQLSWCNKIQNIKNILVKAEKLYKYITNDNCKNINMKERCCAFKKLEQASLLYNKDLSN